MAFKGWPVEALEFFEELEEDNSKAFWQRNKAVYETIVRAPMEALLAELEPDWGESRVFRPYRDVRFSKDKSPYKTAIGARLSAEGLAAGSGMWEMAPDQLDRYREAVADEGSGRKLVSIVAKARAAGLDVTGHDALKTAPKGYPKDHPRIELLRNKGLITWRQWPVGAWLGTRRTRDRLVEFLEASKPLNGWLRSNVGRSEMPAERR